MKIIREGCVEYAIEVIFLSTVSPANDVPVDKWKEEVRSNTPSFRKVCFTGGNSVTEEEDTGFGYKSLSRRYRQNGKPLLYAKEYKGYNFFYPEEDAAVEGNSKSPGLVLIDETKTILEYVCRKAVLQREYETVTAWFTEELLLADDTGAVMVLNGINGAVLQWEVMPVARVIYFGWLYTAINIREETLAPGTFAVPTDYRKFTDADTATNFIQSGSQ